MKKRLLFAVLIVVVILAALAGVHIGNPCDRAGKFWEHIGPNGSNHVAEFGGPEAVQTLLRQIETGQIPIQVYGKITKTIILAPNTPYGAVAIVFGQGGSPTMYVAQKGIADLVKGLHFRDGADDIMAARNVAGCFANAYVPVTVSADNPAQNPSSSSSLAIPPATIPEATDSQNLTTYVMWAGFLALLLGSLVVYRFSDRTA